VAALALPLASCARIVGCSPVQADGPAAHPDLGIATSVSAAEMMLPLRSVRVVNRGEREASGIVSLVLVDSTGAVLRETLLNSGAPVSVPAVDHGGTYGKMIEVPRSEVLRLSKQSGGKPLRLDARIRVQTLGGDRDYSDNVVTVDWSDWRRLAPSALIELPFHLEVERPSRLHFTVESLQVPEGASVVPPSIARSGFFVEGQHHVKVGLHTGESLSHGSVAIVRLTIRECGSGKVLLRHERTAVYDTVAPTVADYRAVVLSDGRVAVQAQVFDEHSAVYDSNVSSRYSEDEGRSWNTARHTPTDDFLGRPALYETVIGPFSNSEDLLVSLEFEDLVGNAGRGIPTDAAVFLAPKGAEVLLYGAAGDPEGNPIFRVESILRSVSTVEREVRLASVPNGSTDTVRAEDAFELRRRAEVRALSEKARLGGVDLAAFRPTTPTLLRLSSKTGHELAVLRLQGLP
jgi:hypothetical protein